MNTSTQSTQILDSSQTTQEEECGWSQFTVEGAQRKRLHYFRKESENSICGFATLSNRNVKQKFRDLSRYTNPKKFCKRCMRKKEMKYFDYT